METSQLATPNASGPAARTGLADRMQHSKALIAIVAVLGITVAALAAALVVNKSDAQPNPYSANTAVQAPVTPVTAPAHVNKLATTSSKPVAVNNTSRSSSTPVQVAKANVCADCGTVESVTAEQRQGQVNGVAVGNQTIGIGTVAGGLLGGIVGNQMGAGNGKTAMTVLGAAGGAYAGNKVEANMKKVTVYNVAVRMDDGSRRNLDVSTSVPVGSKVIVEGQNLRMANAKG
ncbi:MAG: glycine zipper 2TM domain-containing protein [Polaromonas sp.]|uniref:glycine zipper 2TM domain-containing protein n=1 Tax=Polaromonas sp. TaxID=1869339 RepID=UPI0025DE8E22|nr:glycine zipper 2TM domain-containing protein [Polaromonas sp.]MBI2728067.1 glycine zipper 2TM domain-containing protein [Polaromonas sp.]